MTSLKSSYNIFWAYSPPASHPISNLSTIPSQHPWVLFLHLLLLFFLPPFFSLYSLVCVVQIVLGVGAALAYGQMNRGHTINENWLSLSPSSSASVWNPHPSPSNAGILSALSLCRSCTCCHNHHEFMYESALLCLEKTISLMLTTTSNS